MTRKLVFINEELNSGGGGETACNLETISNSSSFSSMSGYNSCASSSSSSESSTSNPKPPAEPTTTTPKVQQHPPCPVEHRAHKTVVPKTKIITSFEELSNLKARSRIPIDIQLPSSASQIHNKTQLYAQAVNNRQQLTANNLINFNEILLKPQVNLLHKRTNLPLSASANVLNTSETINFSSLMSNYESSKLTAADTSSTPTEAKKYFSFLTTNKLFSSYSNTLAPKTSITSPVSNLECVAETLSSPSLSGMNSADSGCGGSIAARSSILSNSDYNDIPPKQCSNNSNVSSSSSSSSSSDLDLKENANLIDSLERTEINSRMRNVTDLSLRASLFGDELSTSSSSSSSTSRVTAKTARIKRTKILTVLFDYESSPTFNVRKGQTVKVIRDYDDNFYLVACVESGKIGFIPKECTVDLKEIRNRFKSNLKHQINVKNSFKSLNSINNSNEVNNDERHFNSMYHRVASTTLATTTLVNSKLTKL